MIIIKVFKVSRGGKSIRTAFIIPLIVPLFIALVFITLILEQGNERTKDSILKDMSQSMIQQIKIVLNQQLSEADKLNNIHIDSYRARVVDIYNQSNREKYFVNLLRNFPEAAMTYIGLSDGSFYGARRIEDGRIQVVRNNEATKGASQYYNISEAGEGISFAEKFDNFNPRIRPWYIKAQENKGTTYSDIYSHFVFKEPTITASYPVYENDKLVGVFGVDYLLTWIGKSLSSLPIGNHGQIFIVDSKKQLVASSSGESIFKIQDGNLNPILASESENKIIRRAMEYSDQILDNALLGFKANNERYYMAAAAFSQYDITWKIYIVLAESDFLSQFNEALKHTEQVSLLFALSFLIFIFGFSAWITRPIIKLNASAKALTKGNFTFVPDDNRQDELGQLTRSFNTMGRKLTELVANLESQVEERTCELQERNEALERLSYLDGLTGIGNRRKFNEFFNKALKVSIENSKSLAVLLIDIDCFKNYNDTYGHVEGDECLKAIGKLLKSIITRKIDLAARFGGEEFIVVLQEIDEEEVIRTSKEILEGIRNLKIEHIKSTYGIVTVSIGIAFEIPNQNQTSDRFIAKADAALYEAKNNGKNRVELSCKCNKVLI